MSNRTWYKSGGKTFPTETRRIEITYKNGKSALCYIDFLTDDSCLRVSGSSIPISLAEIKSVRELQFV